ncbi:MAG: hypothetical protein KDK36_01855, partial [Leptospiraceae bacterium]|nr:hypothetical protein [Leptospiraceae bacterium]
MKKIILILIVTATFSIKADPLTDDQIKSFNIENLNSKSFDTRMNTFRIIEVMDWKDKYRDEIEKAILKMLKSTDIMQKRTGIQGENLLHMDNPDIYEAIVRNVQTS